MVCYSAELSDGRRYSLSTFTTDVKAHDICAFARKADGDGASYAATGPRHYNSLSLQPHSVFRQRTNLPAPGCGGSPRSRVITAPPTSVSPAYGDQAALDLIPSFRTVHLR